MATVRTRFAPSPTGYLHVGGIRTALFAYLLARQQKGSFVLRLEDTDKKREVTGSDKHLMDSLRALGIEYDEGPDIGGDYGPYRQSERLATYKQWAQKLIDSGRAYADPYTAEEVQGFREAATANKQPFLYRNHRPSNPPAWDGSTPLRFKSDPGFLQNWPGVETITDEVMGELNINPNAVDDFILIKSDGYPTYNFAHIVDDAEMHITHVIRGQEFLSSMPNYLDLYRALDVPLPTFAHLPHIMNEQGNKKLGKRDGAKDVLDYVREGYLPEALVSFIATLGWNDGTEQEVFTKDELITMFSLDHVQRSGARFDERRLLWMNGSFIRDLSLTELSERVANYWPPEAADVAPEYKQQVLGLVQERLKFFSELPDLSRFFFVDLPLNPSLISGHKQLKKYDPSQLKTLLEATLQLFESSNFSVDDLQNRLNKLLEETGEKPMALFSLIRIATTQAPASPGLADTLHVLGKVVATRRIQAQIAAL